MSGVWGWFGGGAGQKRKDSPKKAILDLRAQLDMLQKREKHLQSLIEEQENIARKNVATNKAAAKTALRRKQGYAHNMEQTQNQINTLEQQINAIESANINQETLKAMQAAAVALQHIHGKLTPEKVDEVMENIREQNALNAEIVEAMNHVTVGNEIDEDELEDELQNLQQEQLDQQMLNTGTVPVADAVHRMPTAANGELKTPAVTEDDEEAELQKLQAEMAI